MFMANPVLTEWLVGAYNPTNNTKGIEILPNGKDAPMLIVDSICLGLAGSCRKLRQAVNVAGEV